VTSQKAKELSKWRGHPPRFRGQDRPELVLDRTYPCIAQLNLSFQILDRTLRLHFRLEMTEGTERPRLLHGRLVFEPLVFACENLGALTLSRKLAFSHAEKLPNPKCSGGPPEQVSQGRH
jgi:hypothetical protein